MGKLEVAEVIAYAKPIVHKFIHQHAGDAPAEHKAEIEQTAYVRILEAFPGINEDQGWRSFVYNHARGAVLDYLKFGRGFQESKWSLSSAPDDSRTPKLTKRVFASAYGDDETTTTDEIIERALAQRGIFAEMEIDPVVINWPLLTRLASQDPHLHAFLRYLQGQSIEEMADVFGVGRTRVSQMIQEFVERFDDPACADEYVFKQICFGLGLCRHLGMENVDQSGPEGHSVGWKLNPVDLDSMEPCQQIKDQESQMSLFDDRQTV